MSWSTVTTDWGAVERDVIATLQQRLGDRVAGVQSALDEKASDVAPKNFPLVVTISSGTRARRSGKSYGGFIRLDEDWTLDVVIYGSTGLEDDGGRWELQALAARVKGAVAAYSPRGQVDNCSALELRSDEPVQAYIDEGGTQGLKVRQRYVLATQLQSEVTGKAVEAA